MDGRDSEIAPGKTSVPTGAQCPALRGSLQGAGRGGRRGRGPLCRAVPALRGGPFGHSSAGPREARNWFEMREEWGAARQTEKLRNMIDASQHDLDYWTALNEIAIRIQEERRCGPPCSRTGTSRCAGEHGPGRPGSPATRGNPTMRRIDTEFRCDREEKLPIRKSAQRRCSALRSGSCVRSGP